MAKKCSFKLLFNITGLIVTLVLLLVIGFYIAEALKTKESLEPKQKCGMYNYAGVGGEENWPPVTFKKLPDGITCGNVGGEGHGSVMTDSPQSCQEQFFKYYPNNKQGVFTFEYLPSGTAESEMNYHNCYWNDISTCFMTPGLANTWRGSNLTTTGYYTPGVQSTGGQSTGGQTCERKGVTLLNNNSVGQAGCKGFGYGRFQKQDGANGTTNIDVPIVQTDAFKHSWSGACEASCNKADCYGYLFNNSEIDELNQSGTEFKDLSQLKNNNCFLYGPTTTLNTNSFNASTICAQDPTPQKCSSGSQIFSSITKMLKTNKDNDSLQSGDGCYTKCLNTPGCVAYKHYSNYPEGLGPWDMDSPSSQNGENTLCRLYTDDANNSDVDIWPASNTCIMVDPKTGMPKMQT